MDVEGLDSNTKLRRYGHIKLLSGLSLLPFLIYFISTITVVEWLHIINDSIYKLI